MKWKGTYSNPSDVGLYSLFYDEALDLDKLGSQCSGGGSVSECFRCYSFPIYKSDLIMALELAITGRSEAMVSSRQMYASGFHSLESKDISVDYWKEDELDLLDT